MQKILSFTSINHNFPSDFSAFFLSPTQSMWHLSPNVWNISYCFETSSNNWLVNIQLFWELSSVWPSLPSSNAYNLSFSNFFDGLLRSCFLTSKTTLFNLRNHSLRCVQQRVWSQKASTINRCDYCARFLRNNEINCGRTSWFVLW